jgi:hypothetical protein
MTDEERNEILQQAFRNISVERKAKENHGSDLKEDPLEAWERNMPKPEEPKPEPEPPVRKLDTRRQELQPSIYEWIEERLETERKFILECAGEAIGELLDEMHKQAKRDLADEIRELKIELCQLETTLCELRQVIASERRLALPSLPRSVTH